MGNNKAPMMAAAPAPGVILYFAEVCGIHFNVAALKVIDRSGYIAGDPERAIIIKLTEGDEYEFKAEDADQAEYWFLAFTGQAKVQPA